MGCGSATEAVCVCVRPLQGRAQPKACRPPRPPRPPSAADLLKDLKFGPGDGHLQYYLYNWRVATALEPRQVGLILL